MDDLHRVARLERDCVIAWRDVVLARAANERDAADCHGLQADHAERLDAAVCQGRVGDVEQQPALASVSAIPATRGPKAPGAGVAVGTLEAQEDEGDSVHEVNAIRRIGAMC